VKGGLSLGYFGATSVGTLLPRMLAK